MRRGIGVAHVQGKRETQRQMTDLGAQLTAERVALVADQLETLTENLQRLARRHREEIRRDPIARARFRQLADSLGVDLISSKRNVFAGVLGLGDFYYGLAGRVVEACMRERKFCGAYVPLHRIVQVVKRQYDMEGKEGKGSVISEGDVCMALDKLHILGDGYNVVKLGGVSYIQTTPDGGRSVDDVPLLDSVLSKRAQQISDYRTSLLKNDTGNKNLVPPGINRPLVTVPFFRQPIAPIHGIDNDKNKEGNDINEIPLLIQSVSFTQSELEDRLMWPSHRVKAVLERMVQNGSVWIEEPLELSDTVFVKGEINRSRKPVLTATNTFKGERIYWFIALLFQDENT